MDADTDLPQVAITLLVVGVILFVGVNAVSGVIQTGDYGGTDIQTGQSLDGTDWVRVNEYFGSAETVYDSRGNAIELNGTSTSYFQSESDIDLTGSNWTVSVWASRDVDENMTALNIGQSFQLAYNKTTGNYTAWYYEVGDRDSHEVSVSAQSPQNRLEHIVVVRRNDTLTMYSNTTQGTSANLTNASQVSAQTNATSWNGTMDELRISETDWNASTIQSHYNNPIDPLPTLNTGGRAMFDEPYRTDQRFFYESGDIVTNDVDFETGLPGQELASGTDYDWETQGPKLRPLSGGEIEQAPIAYVDYTQTRVGYGVLQGYENALLTFGLLIVLIPLTLVIGYLYNVSPQAR